MKTCKGGMAILLGLIIATFFSTHLAYGLPQFMTLPFDDSSIKLQQGWLYLKDPGPGRRLCPSTNPDYPYCHYGIDYIKGTLDQSRTWQSFKVTAAAEGLAIATSGGGYGTFVYIRHPQTDSKGLNYFTLYGHLKSVSNKIPFVDYNTFRNLVSQGKFSTWVPIGRDELLGEAGDTGAPTGWIHLHFDVQRGGYPLHKTDPYDIYKKRPSYPPYGNCGPNFLWTQCPPVTAGNQPPTITSLTANPNPVPVNGQSTVTVQTTDPENDPLTYTWSATAGSLSGTSGPTPKTWTAPNTPGMYSVTVSVTDNKPGHSPASRSVIITVNPGGNQPPNLPTTPAQYKSDGVTGLALGGTTTESTVVMKGGVSDPNGDTVQLEVEAQKIGTTFTGTPNCTSGSAVASGQTATATCSSLTNGSYHWQARAKDSKGAVGSWISAGGNPESNADFVVSIPSSCSYSISPTSQSFSASAGTGSITVTTQSGCSWSASSNASWITIGGNLSAVGNPHTSGDDATVGTVAWLDTDNIFIEDGVVAHTPDLGSVGPNVEQSIKIVKNGAISGTEKSTGATIPSNLTFVSYGSSADLWGLAWTPADINATNFGVVYAVKNSPSSTISHYLKATNFGFAIPGGATIKGIFVEIKQQNPDWRGFVDYIRITVDYSTASGGSGTGNGTVSYSVAANTSTSQRTGTLTVAGKTFTVTQAGAPVVDQPPNLPTTLSQYKSDGVTGIPLGGTTTESTVVMKGGVSDPDGEALQLQVEVRPVGTNFTGSPNCTSGPAVASGQTATATCSGLANGSYHWQARGKDSTGAGSWLSAGGNLESAADFIVDQPPVAGFSMSSGGQSAQENQTLSLMVLPGGTAAVSFSAARSYDPDGSITAYQWQINGTTVSAVKDFTFSLGKGTQQVFLTVTDNAGLTTSVGGTVVVSEDQPPAALFTMSSGGQSAQQNQTLSLTVPVGGTATVSFSAAASYDPDGSISAYSWQINGSQVATAQSFTFALGKGTQQILLTVTDNFGASSSVGGTVVVTEQDQAPVALFTMCAGSTCASQNQTLSVTVLSGGTVNVSFSASSSYDPDGSITGYLWQINGSQVSTAQNFTFSLGVGTQQIFLTVTDNGGVTNSVGGTVVVSEDLPPVALFSMCYGSTCAFQNQTLTITVGAGNTATVDFSASSSYDPDGSIAGYQWYINGALVSTSQNFSFTLGNGTHQIFLTVTDDLGAQGSVGGTVIVQ